LAVFILDALGVPLPGAIDRISPKMDALHDVDVCLSNL
jgi:hypothetical protein